MSKTLAFFGHRRLWGKNIRQQLKEVIESFLFEELNCLIGTHGDFDKLVLSVCREIKNKQPKINITIVFTSLNFLNKNVEGFCKADMYDDVNTMVYEIEEVYFKEKINVSNRKMIDDSDFVICYVDMTLPKSGAKKAVKYAMKKNKKVINLYEKK